MSWVAAIIGALGGALGTGGLVTVLVQRRKMRAEATQVLTDAAVGLVKPLHAELDRVRAALAAAQEEAAAVVATLHRWRAAILDPRADLDRLRAMVAEPGHHDRNHGGSS